MPLLVLLRFGRGAIFVGVLETEIDMLIHDEITLKQLARTPLFSYMTLEEISEAFHGLKASIRDHVRGSTLLWAGDRTDNSYLLLKGSANI